MGCGCGRSSFGNAAPINIVDNSSADSSSGLENTNPMHNVPTIPVARFEPVHTHGQAPVAQNTNMLTALANLVGSENSSRTGIKLRGIPILRKTDSPKIETANTSEQSLEQLANQTSVPVAATKKYSILNVIKDTLTGTAKYSEENMASQRLQVCGTCPNLLAGACLKCGCIVKLKVKYEESSCPIGKW